jgi:EAL domain-containing protein (putative c-di-GMP-specific phosphodiesterase class I)/ActR/RegA family two-component response regulator
MSKVVIFEDVKEVGELLAQFIQIAGFESFYCPSFEQVNTKILANASHVILDLNMPNFDGLDVLEHLSKIKLKANIILCSGMSPDIIDTAADVLIESGLLFGGILTKPFNLADVKTLLSLKDQQPRSTQFSSKPHQNPILSRLELILALEKNWFYPVFQPQIDVINQNFFGIECLARLNHPLHGTLSPDVFIKKLVEFELINDFTEQFIKISLSQLQKIDYPRHNRISFNIDPVSLTKTFLTKVLDILSQFDLATGQVCLEITEIAAFDTSKEIKSLLTKLRINDVHVSLDDFGTGFSTIHELDNLPFNEIKIDKSFVDKIMSRDSSASIVRCMLDLAKDLNILVIAEGVETQEQAFCLTDMGCQYMQGYLYSKPISNIALTDFFAKEVAIA